MAAQVGAAQYMGGIHRIGLHSGGGNPRGGLGGGGGGGGGGGAPHYGKPWQVNI